MFDPFDPTFGCLSREKNCLGGSWTTTTTSSTKPDASQTSSASVVGSNLHIYVPIVGARRGDIILFVNTAILTATVEYELRGTKNKISISIPDAYDARSCKASHRNGELKLVFLPAQKENKFIIKIDIEK